MYGSYEKWRPSTQEGSIFDAVDDYRDARAKAVSEAAARVWEDGLKEFEAAVEALGCSGFCPELAANRASGGYRRPELMPKGWGEFHPENRAEDSAPLFVAMLDEQARAAKKAEKEAAYQAANNPFAALAALRG